MAILIPNEQLTPTCKHCLFADVEIPAGTFWCRLVQKDVIEEGRPYWCPLREVVRCKVCKYYKQINPNSGYGLCHRDLVATSWPKDGFCSRGERREE